MRLELLNRSALGYASCLGSYSFSVSLGHHQGLGGGCDCSAGRPKGLSQEINRFLLDKRDFIEQRTSVLHMLKQALTNWSFVHYGPEHDVNDQRVYNKSDIDKAQIVWARAIGHLKDLELLSHYHDRRIWRLIDYGKGRLELSAPDRRNKAMVTCGGRHYNLSQAISILDSAIGDPQQGLPEEVSLSVSRMTPPMNVDLLIQDDGGHTRLDDELSGSGRHAPGGIIRYKEMAADRIRTCATGKLGAEVTFESAPILLHEAVLKPRDETRRHHPCQEDFLSNPHNYARFI
jgi:hypothetical protein